MEVPAQNTDIVHEEPLNFTKLLKNKKIPGVFDENSVQVAEMDKAGKEIRKVKCNFIKHAAYNADAFAAGKVLFKVDKLTVPAGEKTEAPACRYYRIEYDVLGKAVKARPYDASQREANMINMGDFEEPDKALYMKEGWVISTGCGLTPEAAHGGKRSLSMLVTPDPEYKSKYCELISPVCRVTTNNLYLVSMWIKANVPDSRGAVLKIGCDFNDRQGKIVDRKIDIGELVRDWRKTEIIVDVPEGISTMKCWVELCSPEGQLYVDDVSINPLSNTSLTPEESRQRTARMYPSLDYYFDISAKYETPHVKWLEPAAAGKIKTLYCNYMRYATATTKRQAVEFAQRMDLDFKYLPLLKRMVTLPSGGSMGFGLYKDETYADDLEQYIVDLLSVEVQKDYNVIVVQGLDFNGIQPEAVETLVAGVRAGKGLVLLDCENLPQDFKDLLVEGHTPFPPNFFSVPDLGDGISAESRVMGMCSLSLLGKGRVAAVNIAKAAKSFPYPNYYGREIPYWEYLQIPAMKAIVWASGVSSGATLDKCAYQAGTLVAEVNSSTARNAILEMTYRDEYNLIEAVEEETVELLAGDNKVTAGVPSMWGGFHLVDCRLMNPEGKIHDFGAYSFTLPVTAEIKKITFNKAYYRPGEEVAAKAVLANIPSGAKLICEVEDTHNRIIKRTKADLTEGRSEALINFKLEAPLTILHRLYVRIDRNGEILAQKMGEFSTPFNYPADDELMAYAWYGQAPGLKVWAANGFDSIIFTFTSRNEEILKTLCNMNVRPFGFGMGEILGSPDPGNKYCRDKGDDLIREPCLSDPDRWDQVREKSLEVMKNDKHPYYGVRDYQLTDELFLGAKVCFCPYCLAGFRAYLKGKYSDLEALNREWGSNFQGWDEVVPIQLSEVEAVKGNLPQWLDHRMFMNIVFAGFVARNKEIVREVNPEAKAGLSGTQNPGISYNWWELMKSMDCAGCYGGIQNDLISSFQHAGARVGQWTGGYVAMENDCEKYEKYHPWDGVFNGKRAYMFWHGSDGGTILGGDLRFTRNGSYAVEELKELKSGTAKMLFSSERIDDGIGMHYSQSSLFAVMGTVGGKYGSKSLDKWGALDSWKYLINDLGFNFNFISYEQLEEGKLTNDKYKIFILPVSVSLSAREIEALRGFVSKGGTLLADYAPGVYDEHGRKCANAELLELFGIKRVKESRINIQECQMHVKPDMVNGLKERRMPVRYGEEGLKLTTGKTFGNFGNPAASAIIVNQFGKGKAILLNCVLSGYATVIHGGGGEMSSLSRGNPKITTPLRELMAEIFSGCKVKPSVIIRTKDGRDFQPLCQTVRYQNGAIRYIGILKQPDSMGKVLASDHVPVEIGFDKGGHIYDVRVGKYLGMGSKVTTTIAPTIAKLYTILPYAVKAVELKSGIAGRPGETINIPVKIAANEGKTGDHVIHVEVIGPDGKARDYYKQNVKLTAGAGVIAINTALSDEKGTWKVIAGDVASGVKGRCEFELQ